MKPYLERLSADAGSSLTLLDRQLDAAIPFQWHHHPEFELTLTLNSLGQRFIGDHVGEYADGDLVLVGPNLPHTWASRAKLDAAQPHVAMVLWFTHAWAQRIAASFIELRSVVGLLERAGQGLQFSPGMARAVRPDLQRIFSLPPPERLLALLAVLDRLAADREAQVLATGSVRQDDADRRERIDRILTHIHAHYARDVALPDLADVAALSLSGLHRLFRKHTQTTISDYLICLRIGDACARLSGTEQPIAAVAEAVGYASLANFNRQFRARKAMTPRQYRDLFRR